jgi:hypothetical protein
VGSWLLPATASAFAAGLLAWSVAPSWLDPWQTLMAGALALVVSIAGAARPRPGGPGPLARAGLLPPDPPTVEAVTPAPATAARSRLAATGGLLAGVLLLGAGWSGLHHLGLESSLLATLAPQRVTIHGALTVDPRRRSYGWSGVVRAERVDWSGGSAVLRAPVWVGGDGSPPHARRGDRVRLEGVLRVPETRGSRKRSPRRASRSTWTWPRSSAWDRPRTR